MLDRLLMLHNLLGRESGVSVGMSTNWIGLDWDWSGEWGMGNGE